MSSRLTGALLGLAAAALFGASTPFSKQLLPGTGPLVLSSMLYLGSAIGLTLYRVSAPSNHESESRLQKSDIGLLAGIVVFGGILGPVLMLAGLSRVSGLTGSLLLNLETPFTVALAILLFGEHLSQRETLAAGVIFLGSLILGYGPGVLEASWLGVLSIMAACASWAVDNNLSQSLSLRDPVAVVRFKSLGAGVCTAALAVASGQTMPGPKTLIPALLLGSVTYGLSLVLNMRALRIHGSARQAAYFSTAPFIGALLSIPILGDRPSPKEVLAAALMVAGIVALARHRHVHPHVHEGLEHEHVHVHDEHHQHSHDEPVTEPHSHLHRHESLAHDHEHTSDLHHRHPHSE